MSQLEAANSGDVRQGAVHAVTLSGTKIGLTRVDGAVQAFVNKCPHLGLPLTKGKIKDGVITCPFHGSSFNLCSGAAQDWVTGIMGVNLPGAVRGVIAMGKTPHGLAMLEASEVDGKVYVSLG